MDIVDVVAVDWTAVRACWKISQFFENNFLLRKFAENLRGAFKCPFNKTINPFYRFLTGCPWTSKGTVKRVLGSMEAIKIK